VAKGPKTGTLYTLKTLIGKSDLAAVTKEGNSADLWHKRLGHMSEKGLKILVGKNLLPGLKSYNLDLCEHCIYGRQRRVSFLRGGHDRKKNVLELVHSDVFGPVNIKSLGGASYFVTFIDDASRKVWAYPMKNKSEVFGIFQKFHVVVERETNKLLKCLRTDNGGEYCSNAFKEYCNRFGIKHEKTVPGTPQQNGVAERMNHTIMEKVRSMLSNSGLEKNFWAEAVRTTCYLINRSPTTALDGGIPEEVWTGKNLNYSHLKIFGCEAFVHIPKENRTKLDDKSMKCIFLGYADEDLVIVYGIQSNIKLLEAGMLYLMSQKCSRGL
jgi:transposase InsO family protein